MRVVRLHSDTTLNLIAIYEAWVIGITIITNHVHQRMNIDDTDVFKSLLLVGVVGRVVRTHFVFQAPARLAHNRRRPEIPDYAALEGTEIVLTAIRDQSGLTPCERRI